MSLAPTLSPRPSAVATVDPSTGPHLGIATPVAWYRAGAVPADPAAYDWRDDLWWPDTAAGQLLAALARAHPHALARL